MRHPASRRSLACLLLAFSANVSALGLGELRGMPPALGESLRLEIELLGDTRPTLDASCFRLIRPAGDDDLPWLKKAAFSLRKGPPAILEIRSEQPLREPVLVLTVQVGCGLEISKEYTLLAMPAGSARPPAPPSKGGASAEAPSAPVAKPRPAERSLAVRPALPPPAVSPEAIVRPLSGKAAQRASPSAARLPSSGEPEAAVPSLRLATELSRVGEAQEAQRELLRFEFRMLLALNEQTTTQLATAEKLRNMEAALGELQQRATEFTQRVERQVQSTSAAASNGEPVVAGGPAAAPSGPRTEAPWLSEWAVYGALLGGALGLGGWLGWRNYRERAPRQADATLPPAMSELRVDPPRDSERDEPPVLDLTVEPPVGNRTMVVDFELDAAHSPSPSLAPPPPAKAADSVFSVGAPVLDEQFEANPVMELADIMLSFGRVKGAAQALQEYIDHNPQEALQPWIRLMDVYRMADMRNEFEMVARNLNRNFNVEIQSWEGGEPTADEYSLDLLLDETVEPVNPQPPATKAMSLEDLPRLLDRIGEQWAAGDVVGYMYQLLRDNRGGKRTGFSLPVVEDILFLIELKETANRMHKEHVVR